MMTDPQAPGLADGIQGVEVEGAVGRAREGARSLAGLTVAQRLEHLKLLRTAILHRREEILDRVCAETHKARSDVLMSELFGAMDAIAWLEHNAVTALADEKIPTPMTLMGKKSRIFYEPLGVMLVISPWNYPFYQAIVPIAFALAAGSTVVYKPSEWTPLPGLIESLLEQAAIPPHWVQVVQGGGDVGAALLEQRPDKVMFTGSTRTGKAIMRAAAEHLIPVELELGGKDPMIVFCDVNIERTAAGAAFGALTAGGQSCTSVERLYVQSCIYEEFIEELVAQVEQLRPASGVEGEYGPMITPFQPAIVATHLEDALERGARLLTGTEWDRESPDVPPLVVVDVPPDSLLATEETFGPVIPVLRFETEAEVVEAANSSAYGLTASVWSADAERADRVARALRCGGVSINNVMATEATPALPFGGVGESGIGRYKGVAGLRAFTNPKSVIVDSDGTKLEANWFPYDQKKYGLFTDMMLAWFSTGPAKLAKFGIRGTRLEGYSQKAASRRG
jgi:acyl-CoA reductase-like NAD-dependent aldehyde dehydrogenase